jgi:penicillin-binding protein 1B
MPPGQRRAVIAGLVAAAFLFLAGFVTTGYVWNLARRFPRAPFTQPSRLYGMPDRLKPGAQLSEPELIAELQAAGYREVGVEKEKDKDKDEKDSKDKKKAEKAEKTDEPEAVAAPPAPLVPGTWRREGGRIAFHLRRFVTPDGMAGGQNVAVALAGNRVQGLEVEGQPAPDVTLEPPLFASFYGPDLAERKPVTLDELPEQVVHAVLAAEDSGFYTHPGVSPTGTARALLVNLKGGDIQGGSTITQQLVKNLYLSRERSLVRKAKEAVIAVLLELRYGKKAILEAYLNEIYWGKTGPANVIGLGAASRAYFGKDPAQLSLAEAATLGGMIQAPGTYLPTEHPQEARERRDWVLQRMAELGWAKPEEVRAATAEPVVTHPESVVARPFAPYFAETAEQEAKDRFGIDKLADEGYALFTTIRWRDQRAAERAVAQGLADLEHGPERRRRGSGPLQSALISIDPRDGAILAYVGGRSYSRSQFDRVSAAHRQAGSAFKPVVYAAAFSEAVATPATILKDSPITVKARGLSWTPQNYDRGFRGPVTVRTALEQSLNIPTVRLALQVGLSRIIALAHDAGLQTDFEPVPALALGAFEVTPREMATLYATLAGGGLRPTLHGLAAVRDRAGEPVTDDEMPGPQRVIPPQAAYLVTSILQGALDRGTASPARALGIQDRLAGKTGTTNDRRDNWFAGYSPERTTVVWVGYDDNARTELSGARAALPIWARFTLAVRPAGGYSDFTPPQGVVTLTIDPVTGQVATEYCPTRVTEVFAEWQAPTEPCQLHSPGSQTWAENGENLPIDPATGLPIQPDAGTEEPVADFGYGHGEEPASPASVVDPQPIDPTEIQTQNQDGGTGSIVIRPTRQHRPEAEPAPAPEANVKPVAPPPAEPPEAQPEETPPAAEPTPEATPPPPGLSSPGRLGAGAAGSPGTPPATPP